MRPVLFQFGIHDPQEHLRFQNIVAKYPLHHAGAVLSGDGYIKCPINSNIFAAFSHPEVYGNTDCWGSRQVPQNVPI